MNDLAVEQTLRQFIASLPASAMSRALSTIESHKSPLHSGSDRRKGGQFGIKLNKLQPYNHRLPCGSVYRQAFLWGVANYLKGFPHEELIVGFGLAQGTRTRIDSVMKVRGGPDGVSLPPDGIATLHDFLDEDERHTAILVHNHPDTHPVLWLLTRVFGDEPLPSMKDRNFGLNAVLTRFQNRIAGFAFGRLRFYLVQHDKISEFSEITATYLLAFLRVAFSVARSDR